MINITEKQFNQLNYISHGGFSCTYYYKNILFKKYHEFVKTNYHSLIHNPCLKKLNYKFTLMKQKNYQLKYTDLIIDTFSINHKFSGVCYPYYNGITMFEKKSIYSFNEKKNILLQLVRNAEELTDHKIYPQDYKLNNIMVIGENQTVKIIDLDDILTKFSYFPNKRYFNNSLYALKGTINSFLENSRINQDFNHLLERYKENEHYYQNPTGNYSDILNYISWHNQKRNFLFIDFSDVNQNNITIIKRLIEKYQVKIVIIIKRSQIFSREIEKNFSILSANHIPIFDTFELENNSYHKGIPTYLNNYHYDSFFDLKNNQILYHDNNKKKLIKKL